MELIEETTTVLRPGKVPKVARHTERRVIKYYIIEIVPPPGWVAQPAQRKVTASTTEADFTLKPGP